MPTNGASSSDSGSLNGGQIAGIVLGVVGAIGLAVLGYSYYMKRNQASGTAAANTFEPLREHDEDEQL